MDQDEPGAVVASPVDAVDVSWLIVTHESAEDLERLLPGLLAALDELQRHGLRSELIVVDNASCDLSLDVVQRLAPGARRIRNVRNLGYGTALNRATAQACGRWLAFCNADLRVPPGGLDALADVLATAPPEVVLVGPALRGTDERPDPNGCRFPSLLRLVFGLMRPDRRRGRRETGTRDVEWLTGACLFARRAAFLGAGGFDEAFFLYYEDVDLALRMRRQGGRAVIDPSLSVVHVRPHHRRDRRDVQTEHLVRAGRRTYFRKHRPAWESRVLALLERLEPHLRPLVGSV
jgi:N-acetylglucosaminyl-diphospho-decaprenol L-rhamnosyltransferase